MQFQDCHPYVQRQPFQPFRIHLTDGTTYDIHHPRMVRVGITELLVGIPAPDLVLPICEGFDPVYWNRIDRIEMLPLTSRSSSKPVIRVS
jgi:hypothetical protein